MAKAYNPVRFTIPKANAEHSNYPCWVPMTKQDGSVARPIVICECGDWLGIDRHHVHKDGTVTASIHHKVGCDWHVHVSLGEWTGQDFAPNQK